jgi:hypothetical protein
MPAPGCGATRANRARPHALGDKNFERGFAKVDGTSHPGPSPGVRLFRSDGQMPLEEQAIEAREGAGRQCRVLGDELPHDHLRPVGVGTDRPSIMRTGKRCHSLRLPRPHGGGGGILVAAVRPRCADSVAFQRFSPLPGYLLIKLMTARCLVVVAKLAYPAEASRPPLTSGVKSVTIILHHIELLQHHIAVLHPIVPLVVRVCARGRGGSCEQEDHCEYPSRSHDYFLPFVVRRPWGGMIVPFPARQHGGQLCDNHVIPHQWPSRRGDGWSNDGHSCPLRRAIAWHVRAKGAGRAAGAPMQRAARPAPTALWLLTSIPPCFSRACPRGSGR